MNTYSEQSPQAFADVKRYVNESSVGIALYFRNIINNKNTSIKDLRENAKSRFENTNKQTLISKLLKNMFALK